MQTSLRVQWVWSSTGIGLVKKSADVVDTLDPDDLEVPLVDAITDTVGEVSLAKLTATALPVASLTGA